VLWDCNGHILSMRHNAAEAAVCQILGCKHETRAGMPLLLACPGGGRRRGRSGNWSGRSRWFGGLCSGRTSGSRWRVGTYELAVALVARPISLLTIDRAVIQLMAAPAQHRTQRGRKR